MSHRHAVMFASWIFIVLMLGCRSQPAITSSSGVPLKLSAIGVHRFGGFDETTYRLLITDEGCGYFWGANGFGLRGTLKGRFVGTDAQLFSLSYLLSKVDLLAATPAPVGKPWPIDGGGELTAIFFADSQRPSVVYASPGDPPQSRVLAMMVDSIGFNANWVPYKDLKEDHRVGADERRVLDMCPWPDRLWAALP